MMVDASCRNPGLSEADRAAMPRHKLRFRICDCYQHHEVNLPGTILLAQFSRMNFAPYQDVDPERERALSPPPQDGRRSKSPEVRTAPTRSTSSPPNLSRPDAFVKGYPSAGSHVGAEVGAQDRSIHFDGFQTSLPLRLDYEAMLAYLLLPPAGPVMLLLIEHKSDYVR